MPHSLNDAPPWTWLRGRVVNLLGGRKKAGAAAPAFFVNGLVERGGLVNCGGRFVRNER